MKTEQIRYQTELSVSECINRITAEPWVFGDQLDPLWYRCDGMQDHSLLVTFRGGKYRKLRKTQYRITLTPENGRTIVSLELQGELWGLPPMTPMAELDRFAGQKLGGVRIG